MYQQTQEETITYANEEGSYRSTKRDLISRRNTHLTERWQLEQEDGYFEGGQRTLAYLNAEILHLTA